MDFCLNQGTPIGCLDCPSLKSSAIEVTFNYEPLVALVFGLWASKRRPWKGVANRLAHMKSFTIFSLPFVIIEAGTGVLSYATGILAIPPLLGLGTAVDTLILVEGIVVAIARLPGKDRRAIL